MTSPLFVASVRLVPAGLVLIAWAASTGRPVAQGGTWLAISLFAAAAARLDARDGACRADVVARRLGAGEDGRDLHLARGGVHDDAEALAELQRGRRLRPHAGACGAIRQPPRAEDDEDADDEGEGGDGDGARVRHHADPPRQRERQQHDERGARGAQRRAQVARGTARQSSRGAR